MLDKQTLIIELLNARLSDPETKVGILAKGIGAIDPEAVAISLSKLRSSHIYVAAVGYGIANERTEDNYTITPAVEKAVLWRSIPEYAGSIVVFVKNDTDKLHSLAEFEPLSLKDSPSG